MQNFQPKAQPVSFYDAIIYSLDHVSKEILKIAIPIPFAMIGSAYFANALTHGDAKGMLVGGLATIVSSAISYYQYRQVEKCDEESLRSMQTHTEQLPSLETRIIEVQYRVINDLKQLSLPK